jgi:hypothetical protein
MPAPLRGIAGCARGHAPIVRGVRRRIARAENASRISVPRFAQKSGFGERR